MTLFTHYEKMASFIRHAGIAITIDSIDKVGKIKSRLLSCYALALGRTHFN